MKSTLGSIAGGGVIISTLLVGCGSSDPAPPEPTPDVTFYTNRGRVRLALDGDKAPITVNNFLHYTDTGFYDSTAFYRVVAGFVVQGGDVDEQLNEKTTGPPIPSEADNGLKNVRGSLAMARGESPDSATAAFYVNLQDNGHLDHTSTNPGYTVFGRVVEGMSVVDAIAATPTVVDGDFDALPVPLVVLNVALEVPPGEPAPVLEAVPGAPFVVSAPPGLPNFSVGAVNGHGSAVGWAEASGHFDAFFWSSIYGSPIRLAPPDPTSLGLAATSLQGIARDINDSGLIVGSFIDSAFDYPVRWNADAPSTATPLPLLDAQGTGAALAVNNGGLIVGYVTDADFNEFAVSWRGHVIKSLGALSGYTESQAVACNDSGWIAGNSRRPGEHQATIWNDSSGPLAVPVPAGFTSFATGVNDAGVVVGTFSDPEGNPDTRLFRWTLGGDFEDLGAPEGTWVSSIGSGSPSIDDAGQISLGVFSSDGYLNGPYLWTEHRGFEALVVPEGSEGIGSANAITPWGIIGIAKRPDEDGRRGVLWPLNPIPPARD